jgi:hypothetical protein
MQLTVLPGRVSICRLAANDAVPDWAAGPFVSTTRTERELSIVCAEAFVPEGIVSSPGWRVLQVIGPLEFSLIGILSSLAAPLAEAAVSIFAVSTYDTDQLLVRDHDLERALTALTRAGHEFIDA